MTIHIDSCHLFRPGPGGQRGTIGGVCHLRVRAATRRDLAGLTRALGSGQLFAERLGRQREGRGLLLVASVRNVIAGSVYLWLEAAEEPELRERLPGVPLLQHLVVRREYRNRRIGTALVAVAERLLHDLGYRAVALGVRPDNVDAIRLYRRLNYREWGHPPIPTVDEEFLPNGSRRRSPATCRIFVKLL